MEENKPPQLTDDERELFENLMPEDLKEIMDTGVNRRHFMKLIALAGGGILAGQNGRRRADFDSSAPGTAHRIFAS